MLKIQDGGLSKTAPTAKRLFIQSNELLWAGKDRPRAEFAFRFMFKRRHSKSVITLILAAFVLLLLGTNTALASHRHSDGRLSYLTRLDHDLDGDHIPETATIRQRGHVYQINIHFTTGRPKLHLTTYVAEAGAVLSFQTADVNNDRKNDLVVTSATSIRPLAIWLNQGKSKFQKISSWSYLVRGYTGPEYRRKSCQPDPAGAVAFDPLPQATLSSTYFDIGNDVAGLLCSLTEKLTFASGLRQIPPRGPPATTPI